MSQLDFFQIRDLLHKELPNGGYSLTQDKEEILFRAEKSGETEASLPFLIGRIKMFFENLRIVNWDSLYISLQSLPDNQFEKDTKERIRFRFFLSQAGIRFEASKRGSYNPKEIQACLSVVQSFQSDAMSKPDPLAILGKLGAEVILPDPTRVEGFNSILGYRELKERAYESLVLPLEKPNLFQELSKLTRIRPTNLQPRAALFEGEPGVGKTTMARALGTEAQIPLVYVPIESILSKYYGESSQNLAAIFDASGLFPKAYLFLDEIDSLATSREDGLFEATRNLLSVLLRKMDGLASLGQIITIGATNRKEDLDPALLSRFDLVIRFSLPDSQDRVQMLGGFAKQLSDEEKREVAQKLEGVSGRGIKDFCDSVERHWLNSLLKSGKSLSPPPLSLYLELSKPTL